jgi:hypothetical protein
MAHFRALMASIELNEHSIVSDRIDRIDCIDCIDCINRIDCIDCIAI